MLGSEQPPYKRNYYMLLISLKAWNRTHTHTDSHHAAFIRSKQKSDVYIKGQKMRKCGNITHICH